MNLQDRVDDYVMGRMDTDERALFEQEMAGDAALRERVALTADVRQAVSSRAEKMAAMARFRKTRERKERRGGVFLWAAGVAAALVFAVFMVEPAQVSNDVSAPEAVTDTVQLPADSLQSLL